MSHAFDLARIARTGAPVVDTSQALRALPIYDGVAPQAVTTKSAAALGDGGGGIWEWDSGSTTADNGGTILAPSGGGGNGRWIRITDDLEVKAAWWGLVDGGLVNCSPQIQAALDYAAIIAPASSGSITPGTAVVVPTGTFLIETPLQMLASGISLIGTRGRGAELTGPGTIVNIGDQAQPDLFVWGCSLYDMVFSSSTTTNASAGIVLNNTISTEIVGLEIRDFYICLDCVFARRHIFQDLIFDQRFRTIPGYCAIRLGGASLPTITGACSDITITNCQFTGAIKNSSPIIPYGVLINSCDGLYMSQTHMALYSVSVCIDPLGTKENYHIASLLFSNVYFDGPNAGTLVPRNVEIIGNVKHGILTTTGTTVSSIYTTIMFVNCQFRAGGIGVNGLYVNITDENSWGVLYQLDSIQISNSSFRTHLSQAVLIPAESQIKPATFIITGTAFVNFNTSYERSVGGALDVSGGEMVLTSCSFDNGDYPSDYIITTEDATEGLLMVGNNFAKAIPVNTTIRLNPTQRIPMLCIANNLLNNGGRSLEIQKNYTTTDAANHFPYSHYPELNSCGYLEVVVTALGPSGTTYSCRFKGAWRRDAGGVDLYNAGTAYTLEDEWNPDAAITVVPRLTVTGTNIALVVQGIAGQTWNWGVRVKSLEPV
jgi:hypothetical protein